MITTILIATIFVGSALAFQARGRSATTRGGDAHESRQRDSASSGIHVIAAVAGPRRQVGYGQVRFNGLGPEAWAAKYRRENRLRRRLEQERFRSHRLLGRRFRRDVAYALKLAATVYGIPERELWAVSGCETGRTWNPYSYNSGSGASGLFQWIPSSWRSMGLDGFSPFDPVAAALATARRVSRNGSWMGWTCRP